MKRQSKMMRFFAPIVILFPLFAIAQDQPSKTGAIEKKGIQFISGLGWSAILAKAQREKKIIFVDCYTTWCAPCKQMEKEIYPLDTIGKFFNENFISVKVQLDKTVADEPAVKDWYDDAKYIETTYSVDAYPTYLFVSPEGKPLHRASGAFSPRKFLSIANNALSPETQSYTLAAKYDPDKMDTAEMRSVALLIGRAAPELAAKIALSYLQKINKREISKQENIDLISTFRANHYIKLFAWDYLSSLRKQELFRKESISLIVDFTESPKDPFFNFLYLNTGQIDEVMNKGKVEKSWFTKSLIDNLIAKQEVDPVVSSAITKQSEPDWKVLFTKLQKKYGIDYADRLTIQGKMSWFGSQKDYEHYSSYIVRYMDKYADELEYSFGRNQYAWAVFKYSNDIKKLEKALSWSGSSLLANPQAYAMDTYANILHKLGRRSQAIIWEEMALLLDPRNEEMNNTLVKIKKGEPTWPLNQTK